MIPPTPLNSPGTLDYARNGTDSAVQQIRKNVSKKWRLVAFRAFLVLLAISAGLYVRHALIQSRRPHAEHAGLHLLPDDELLDVEVQIGMDQDEYFKFRMSSATYNSFYANIMRNYPA